MTVGSSVVSVARNAARAAASPMARDSSMARMSYTMDEPERPRRNQAFLRMMSDQHQGIMPMADTAMGTLGATARADAQKLRTKKKAGVGSHARNARKLNQDSINLADDHAEQLGDDGHGRRGLQWRRGPHIRPAGCRPSSRARSNCCHTSPERRSKWRRGSWRSRRRRSRNSRRKRAPPTELSAPSPRLLAGHLVDQHDEQDDHQYTDRPHPHPAAHPPISVVHREPPLIVRISAFRIPTARQGATCSSASTADRPATARLARRPGQGTADP